MVPTGEHVRSATQSSASGAVGAIPFRLRIGVTGHRTLPDPSALADRVHVALQRVHVLAHSSAHTPVSVSVVSPLAEGADRLVAESCLKEAQATLEVPLPLPADDYIQDFETEESKREFLRLLEAAAVITTLPPVLNRDEAYEQVGRYVVDRCDVLIALWDGQPAHGYGGTADIVARARARGVPLLWIHTEAPYEMTEELGAGVPRAAFEQLDEYNSTGVDEGAFRRAVDGEVIRYAAAADEAGLGANVVQPYLSWIWPFFARADALAVRYQTLYVRFAVSQFALGAAAVAVVATQLLFFPTHPEYAWFEVLLMLSLLVILYVSRRWKLHERWISHRYLAEQLRTAFFLALADVGGSRRGSSERVYAGGHTEAWLDRAYDEVWSQRPDSQGMASRMEQLKRFLGTHWILDQRNYHEKVSHRNERKHQRLTTVSALLFAVTLLAAVLHALGVGHESHAEAPPVFASASYVYGEYGLLMRADPPAEQSPLNVANVLTFLAIVLPAVAGALGGIHAQREYHRNAERFGRMVPVLDAAHRRLVRADDPQTLQAVVQDVESLLLDEVRDWFVVMRFHDIELHV